MSHTMPLLWTRSHATRRRNPAPSSLLRLRLQDAKDAARDFFAREFPPRTKALGISSQEMCQSRVDGGGVGRVAALMHARPDKAMVVAEYLMSVARCVNAERAESLTVALLREARADAAEDVTQQELLADMDNIEKQRAHLAALDTAIAEAQKVRDTLAAKIAERERA